MNPAIAANQQRLFLAFVAELRPRLGSDSSLPRRIKEILARNRAIGSRDRKLYRELVYTWLRFRPWIDRFLGDRPDLAARITAWLAPDLKPTGHYRAALCGDWPPVPPTLAAKAAILSALAGGGAATATDRGEKIVGSRQIRAKDGSTEAVFQPEALLPSWFREHCPAAFASPHLDALNRRANIWVRIQTRDRRLVLDEFRARGWACAEQADFPDAVRLPPNAEVAATDAYRRGFVEIQDLGSQMVLLHAPVAPDSRWLDACAGAGGKTLQLARLLDGGGHVDATDIRPEILDELRDRARRARLDNVEIVRLPQKNYDGVLVDAPCSGSGTWRRQPHLKWYVRPRTIAAFARTQSDLLAANSERVRPGGLLVYATCSLSRHENLDVVAAFLKVRAEFSSEEPAQDHGGEFDGLGTTLLPGTRDTDGFYVALLRRR